MHPWVLDSASLLAMLPIPAIGPFGMFLGILAGRHAEVGALAPYTYARVVATGFIVPLLFNKALTLRVVIGSIIIVIACVWRWRGRPRCGDRI